MPRGVWYIPLVMTHRNSDPWLRLLLALILLLSLVQADGLVSERFRGSEKATILDYTQPDDLPRMPDNEIASRKYIHDFVSKVVDATNPLDLQPDEIVEVKVLLGDMGRLSRRILWGQFKMLEKADRGYLETCRKVIDDDLLRNDAFRCEWHFLEQELDRVLPQVVASGPPAQASDPPSSWDPMRPDPLLQADWDDFLVPDRRGGGFLPDALMEAHVKCMVYALLMHQQKKHPSGQWAGRAFAQARRLVTDAANLNDRWRSLFRGVVEGGAKRLDLLGKPDREFDGPDDLSFPELVVHFADADKRLRSKP